MRYHRIISIGAHSLDAELMGGPLMIRYAQQGAHCTFCHVTQGRLERPDAAEEEKAAYLEQIRLENQKAARAMLCDVKACGYLSSQLPPVSEFAGIIKEYLQDEKADLVITHARGTLHPRHYYVYEAVTSAVRQLQSEGMKIRLLYGENCEDLAGFAPTRYVPLTEEQKRIWFEGLEQYAIFNGKVNDMPYKEYYNAMGKVRAVEIDSEGFVKAYMDAPYLDTEI